MTIETRTADLFRMLTGKRLGEGCYRTVYENACDHKTVIKESTGAGHSHNMIEYEFWKTIEGDKKMAQWFAPCYVISEHGIFLIQARTTPVSVRDLPKKVPYLMTDLKPTNWGWYKNRVVCHDYGNVLYRTPSAVGNRMRSAKWFGTTNR